MDRISWPSERIPQGGLFHTSKVNYSKATHDMIKALMEEAQVTMMQRNKINYFLRNGESLPQPKMQRRTIESEAYEMRRAQEILSRSRVARKRSLDTIVESGVFERDKYIPRANLRNNETAKKQLQEKMSGLKEYPELQNISLRNKDKHRKKSCDLHSDDRIAELLNEIYERLEWLKEMEELGESKKHTPIINAQVTERLLEIKQIEKKMMQKNLKGKKNVVENED